jgi:hypothetical protein
MAGEQVRPHHRRAVVTVLFGLLLVVCSAPETTGGEFVREPEISMRPISTKEVMGILRKFPSLVPSYFSSHRDNAEFLASNLGFSELAAAPLKRVLPTARFYQYLGGGTRPPHTNLIAVMGDKSYVMPGQG